MCGGVLLVMLSVFCKLVYIVGFVGIMIFFVGLVGM